MKNKIKAYFKENLDTRLHIDRIDFRKKSHGLCMSVKGGVDSKAKASINVETIEELMPNYNKTDTMLRIHSLNQYFIRYNMANDIQKELTKITKLVEVGILLDKFDYNIKQFKKYSVILFLSDGSTHKTDFKGNPAEYKSILPFIIGEVYESNRTV